MKVLEAANLSSAYRKTTVLDDVNFDGAGRDADRHRRPERRGQIDAAEDAAGSASSADGRSPFLRHDLAKVKKRIGYVPQRGSVDWDFPTDALDVVMMGLYGQIGWFRLPRRRHQEKSP